MSKYIKISIALKKALFNINIENNILHITKQSTIGIELALDNDIYLTIETGHLEIFEVEKMSEDFHHYKVKYCKNLRTGEEVVLKFICDDFQSNYIKNAKSKIGESLVAIYIIKNTLLVDSKSNLSQIVTIKSDAKCMVMEKIKTVPIDDLVRIDEFFTKLPIITKDLIDAVINIAKEGILISDFFGSGEGNLLFDGNKCHFVFVDIDEWLMCPGEGRPDFAYVKEFILYLYVSKFKQIFDESNKYDRDFNVIYIHDKSINRHARNIFISVLINYLFDEAIYFADGAITHLNKCSNMTEITSLTPSIFENYMCKMIATANERLKVLKDNAQFTFTLNGNGVLIKNDKRIFTQSMLEIRLKINENISPFTICIAPSAAKDNLQNYTSLGRETRWAKHSHNNVKLPLKQSGQNIELQPKEVETKKWWWSLFFCCNSKVTNLDESRALLSHDDIRESVKSKKIVSQFL